MMITNLILVTIHTKFTLIPLNISPFILLLKAFLTFQFIFIVFLVNSLMIFPVISLVIVLEIPLLNSLIIFLETFLEIYLETIPVITKSILDLID